MVKGEKLTTSVSIFVKWYVLIFYVWKLQVINFYVWEVPFNRLLSMNLVFNKFVCMKRAIEEKVFVTIVFKIF
jgi:hypothetical protein